MMTGLGLISIFFSFLVFRDDTAFLVRPSEAHFLKLVLLPHQTQESHPTTTAVRLEVDSVNGLQGCQKKLRLMKIACRDSLAFHNFCQPNMHVPATAIHATHTTLLHLPLFSAPRRDVECAYPVTLQIPASRTIAN